MSFVRTGMLAMATLVIIGTAPLAAQTPQKPPAASPQQTAPAGAGPRIGFINVSALLKGMPGYQQAESTFAKDGEAAQAEAQKIRAVFDSAVATYQQSQAMMTPSNRTAREKQLQVQQDSVQAKLQAIQTRLANRERELLTPMQERLKAIIDGIRAEGNYVMIIDLASTASENIVSYDKSMDITLRVAQRLAQAPSN